MKFYFGNGTFKTVLGGFITLMAAVLLTACGGGDGFTGNRNVGAYVGASLPSAGTSLMTTSPADLTLEAGKSASFVVSGGTAPYRVNSSNPGVSLASMVDATTFSLSGAATGSALVKIFDDVGASVAVNVTVVAAMGSMPLFTTAPGNITIATGAEPSYGIGGGIAPFRVVSNDVSVATILNFKDTEFKLQGVKGGVATVVLSDSTGATKSIQVTVSPTATTPLVISPANASASVGDLLIFRVNGGAPSYEVLVNNTSITSANTSTVANSGGSFSLKLLKAGSTTIAITDTLGQTQTVSLTATPAPGLSPLFTTAPGSITMAIGAEPSYGIGGGSGPFRVISNDISVVTTLTVTDTEFKLKGVKGGTATVVLIDSTGATKSIQVTVSPTATTPLLISPASVSASIGDVLVFKVSGGEPGYNVLVNNTSIAIASTAKVSASGGTFTLNLLKVGSTSIAITDGLGQTQTVTLTVDASETKLRLAPSALTIDENFKDSIAFSIYGGVPGATYKVFSSDQALFSTPLPFSNSATNTFMVGVGTAGNRCITPNNVAPATVTGILEVKITVVDQAGASAVSVVSVRDNALGCP